MGYAGPYCAVGRLKLEEDGRQHGGNGQQRAASTIEGRPSAGRPKWRQMIAVPARGTDG